MGTLIFGSGGGGAAGPDLSGDTVEPKYVRDTITFHDRDGNAQVGEIPNWSGTISPGASTDANKMEVAAATSKRHIKGGCYLHRDLELKAMPTGGVTYEIGQAKRSGESVYRKRVLFTKSAGYIAAGTDTVWAAPYTGDLNVAPGKNAKSLSTAGKWFLDDQTITVLGDSNLVKENIRNGVPIFGVTGTYAGTTYQTYNGVTTITPGSTTQYFQTAGKYVGSNLAVLAAPTPPTVQYSTPTVYPSGGTLTISCSGTTLLSFSLVIAAATSTAGQMVSCMGQTGSATGRCSVVNGSGNGVNVGNVASLVWNGNTVTVTLTGGYTFGGSYNAYLTYM